MKTLIFSMLIFLFTVKINAQTNQVIKVENANQFVDAIGSNRIIQIRGSIILSEVSSEKGATIFTFLKSMMDLS